MVIVLLLHNQKTSDLKMLLEYFYKHLVPFKVLFLCSDLILLGLVWPGHGIDHPLPSSTKVKQRVELYLY
jgi:hypothetical protein